MKLLQKEARVRYTLLYDGGCDSCSAAADAARKHADGLLSVRSLRDSAVQRLLDEHASGWRWQPALLVEGGSEVTVLTGTAMLLRLVRVLGPRRGWRVMHAVNAQLAGNEREQPGVHSRRSALRLAGGTALAIGGLALGSSTAFAQQPATQNDLIEGPELDRLTEETLGSPEGREALAAVREAGYEPAPGSRVAFRVDGGNTMLILLFGSIAEPETKAAAILRETRGDGAVLKVEYITLEAAAQSRSTTQSATEPPPPVFSVDNGPRFVVGDAGGVTPQQRRGWGSYFACIGRCMGVECALVVSSCNKLPGAQAKIACMVVRCPSRGPRCHRDCRGLL